MITYVIFTCWLGVLIDKESLLKSNFFYLPFSDFPLNDHVDSDNYIEFFGFGNKHILTETKF